MTVNWKISDVETILGASARGAAGGTPVRGVSTDSRTAAAGDLFVALAGERFDGHDYVGAAAGRGAVAAVVARGVDVAVPQLVVRDTREALRLLARARRRDFRGPVVAITGSCGKTTTKEFVAAALAGKYRVRVSPANFNNEVGVPLSLLALEAGDEALVVEVGVSAPGEMAPLAAAVAPTVAVVTNVAPTHLEFFGDVAAVRREKMQLLGALKHSGTAVLNAADPLVTSMASEADNGFRVVTYGLAAGADVRPLDLVSEGFGGSRFRLSGGAAARVRLPGEHNVLNALAAVAVARVLGVTEDDVAAGLATCVGGALRSQVATNGRGVTYLVDCYNSSPQAAQAALALLALAPAGARRVAVLGDMLELGETGDCAHRGVGRFAFEHGVQLLVGLGAGGRAVVAGAVAAGMPPARTRAFDAKDELAAYLGAALAAGDVVLFKASRGIRLEEVLDKLGVRY